jgi:hypothetical protein
LADVGETSKRFNFVFRGVVWELLWSSSPLAQYP